MLQISSAQPSHVILPLSVKSTANMLCFEKALFMSGWDLVAICLPSAHWPANCCFPCFSSLVFISFSLLKGCITNVEKWLLDNCGVILGICVGVAVVEVGLVNVSHSIFLVV